ncbi:MAG: ABC transporter permease subunit [Planctomycetaceae bacterium]|nr:ABC transporter permease subunit [Planctomycetaceae bacterium]
MNPQTSKLRLMRWRLLGKELRQLFPIFAAAPVALIAFLFLVPTIGEFPNIRSGLPWELAFQLPGVVFSLGAVGLLVCQEKEQRSLQWLAALPIPPLEIVWGKLLAGIVGVALVLMTSLLASLLLQPLFPVQLDLAQWLLCLAINLYILVVGLAIGWRMESTMGAMFLILVLAFVPAGLAQGIDYVVFPEPNLANQSGFYTKVLVGIFYVTLGIVAFFLVWLWGRRSLTAMSTKNPDFDRSWLPYRVSSSLPKQRHLMSPAAGLIWQMVRQNAWSLMVISLIFAISLGQLAIYQLEYSTQIAMIAALATSWLGVMTFGGDSHKHQVRFLADRGVSPATVWWTRQLVSISMLSLFALSALAVALMELNKQIEPQMTLHPNRGPLTFVNLLFLLLLMLMFLFSVYAFSQWLGQYFQSVILAIVIVPPVAISAAMFAITLFRWLGIDILFVGMLTIFPMVGTWLATRTWMDRRLGFRSAVAQLSVTFGGIAIVLGSLIAWPLMVPLDINPTIKAEMQEFQQSRDFHPRIGSSYRPLESNFAVARRQIIDEESERLAQDFRQNLLQELSRIEADLAFADNALDWSLYRSDGLFLESLAELVPGWDMDATERTDLFNRVLRAHFQLHRRIRQSDQIPDQDTADLAEIWSLQQLMQPERSQLVEDQLYNEMVSYLADDLARQEARRRALIMTRSELEQQEISIWQSNGQWVFAGLFIPPSVLGNSAAARNRQHRQNAIQLLEDLWVLSGESIRSQDEILKRVAENREELGAHYGIGRLGKYFRVNDVAAVTPSLFPIYQGRGLPGQQWRAGWEQQAKRLAKRPVVSETPTVKSASQGVQE